jgi:hypothetical protein
MESENKDELSVREQLAAIQHSIWAHWMKFLFSVSHLNPDGSVTIPAKHAKRWMQQVETTYEELSEREKYSDREQADKVLAALHDLY